MKAIEFENVGKQYRLGLVSTGTISHDLNRWWTMNVLRKEDPYLKIGETNDRSHKGDSDYVWALKDINFSIEQGDVVGIIGKNGAGKSTLLKLLSRVTTPTTGCIRARGRIASLLEVGTGFHPEMTGRENIFMNGAIMGMTKREIASKLDEIVDFSGCERYIDTPVKRYSSGMTVRLGFAIAAHLEPEILVVDEVLAVGDAEFQKKAIGKMKDVSQGGGRTVLFVSHNMAAVRSLCKGGILLDNGMVKEIGDVNSIIGHYLKGENDMDNYKTWSIPTVKKEGFTLLEIGIRRSGGNYKDIIRMEDELEIELRYRLENDYDCFYTVFHIKNERGDKILTSTCRNKIDLKHQKGIYKQTCKIPANYFNWGNFSIDFHAMKDGRILLTEEDLISWAIVSNAVKQGFWMGRVEGDIIPDFDYKENLI